MASRAQQKEEARRRRLETERADSQRAQRRRRVQLLSGVVVIALVIVGVVIAISAGGGARGLAKGAGARKLSASVGSLLAGIPQHGTTLGNPHARYTLTFFGDLQCPVCAAFATGASLGGVTGGLPRFIADQVRPGHVKLVYRSECTATCNDFGQGLFETQQVAAYAAGEQDRFWDYDELFYRQQGAEGTPYVTPTFLRRLAQEIPGLNLTTWSRDRGDPALLAQVEGDEAAAARTLPKINGEEPGTPSLVMSGPRGSHFIGDGVADYAQLVAGMRTVS